MTDDTSSPEPEVVSETEEPSPKTQLAVASEILPISLHILPVHERPFFPVHAMPLILDEKVWQGWKPSSRWVRHPAARLGSC